MKRIATILAALMIAISLPSFAQKAFGGLKPVEKKQEAAVWDCSVKMTSKNKGEVLMTLTVGAGWHIYGANNPDGPIPMGFDFSTSEGVKFAGEPKSTVAPNKEFDSMFDANTEYFTGTVTFVQKFTVTDRSKAKINVVVSCQGCNDETCTRPMRKTFNLDIPAK